MDFFSRFYGDTMIFKPKNVLLDDLGTLRFKRELMMALGKGEIKTIIINLSTVKMQDSTGLGALLFARRYAIGKGGECVLVFPAPKVMNQLKQSKLTDSFRIIDKDEEYQALKKELEESLNIPEPLEEEEELEELEEEEDNGQDKLIYNGMPEPAVPNDDDFTFEE
ncbi:MAG: STAS domain-containing protein [Fidelibacterota bacterium]